jgi:hypothetical protein
VNPHPRQAWGNGRAWCARAVSGLWHNPPAGVHPAASRLELPLRAAPRRRTALWLLRLLILAYALELLLLRHWLVALLVAGLAVACLPGHRASGLRCLWLEGDGRLFLIRETGGVEQVWLGSAALRLGPYLLLVLHGVTGSRHLLLGPDNLAAAELAALGRRLAGGTASPATALHSVAAPGSKSTDSS